jgi:hypothetical protein
MTLLADKAETPLRAATRIFGAVVIALALLLGTLTAIRPPTLQGLRMALRDHYSGVLSQDDNSHGCANQGTSRSVLT